MNRARKILRGMGGLALAVCALALLAGVGLLFWLNSTSGERAVRAQLLGTLNDAIRGELEAGDIELSALGGEVVLHEVVLRDPDGELVARIGTLRLKADLRELARRRFRAKRVHAEDAELHLVGSPEGMNIDRAFTARTPRAPGGGTPSGGGPGWDIEADDLTISGLRFSLRSARGAPPSVDVRDITLSLSGRYGPRGSALSVAGRGQALAPVSGPLSLEGKASGGTAARPWTPLTFERVEVQVGDSRALLSGGLDGPALAVKVEEALLRRSLVAQLLPGAPLAGDVALSGTYRLDRSSMSAQVEIPVGKGKLSAEASARLPGMAARGTLSLQQLDLSQVLRGAPSTRLNGSLQASFEPSEPRPGRIGLDLSLARSSVREVAILGAEVRLRSNGEQASVEKADVTLAGGKVKVSGEASLRRLDLRGTAALSDLTRFNAALAGLAGGEAPRFSGRGQLAVRLTGKTQAPAIALEGRLDRFEAGEIRVEGMALKGSLPDASKPFLVDAELTATHGHLGELPFSRLEANVETDRRAFRVDFSTRGLAGMRIRLDGEMRPDLAGARVERLFLATNDARWRMERPAQVDFASGFRVDGLALVSGDQRVELAGGLERGRLQATARVQRLDLAKAPRILVSERLRLQGRLELEARASGSPSLPRVEAKGTVAGFGIDGYDGLDGEFAAKLSGGDRLEGTAGMKRGSAAGKASFDLPIGLLSAPGAAPMAATVQLDRERVADLGTLFAVPGLKGGLVSVRAQLSGTSAAPKLSAKIAGTQVGWQDYPPVDVDLQLTAAEELRAQLELVSTAGTAAGHGLAQVTLRELLAADRAPALSALPLEVQLDVPTLDLATFAGRQLPAQTAGLGSASVTLRGSAARPRGTVRLSVARGRFGRRGELTLEATANATDEAVDVWLQGHQGQVAVLSASGALRAAPERLWSFEGLGSAPIEAKVAVGPVELDSLREGEPSLAVAGGAKVEASLSGTLGAPVVSAKGRFERLSVGGRALGALEATADYARAAASVQATLAGEAPVQARGTLQLDLGLAALRKGPAWRDAPLAATVDARDLDLALLEALLPDLRQVGGRATVAAQVSGSLGRPVPRGELTVREGRATVVGYGRYRDLSAALVVDDRVVALRRLTVRAGKGSAEIAGTGKRASAAEPYQVEASVKLDKFPVVVGDRELVLLTGGSEALTGQVRGLEMGFDVRLGRLQVDLPSLQTKDVQVLESHPDVKVVKAEGRRKAKDDGAGIGGGALKLRVGLQAPRILVQSSDARIDAGADLILSAEGAKTELTGDIITRSGRADVLGRKFELQRGRISYASDPPSNPRLDIQALHENLREQVKVKVGITGTAQKPRVELSSEPALDESQIAMLLATGRKELKRGSGGVASSGRAASVVGSFAADRLRKAIATQLPLDVLKVEMDDEGPASAQLEAGTYVNDRLYLGYRRDFGATTDPRKNGNEVRVEYQLSPRVTLESQYGDRQKGGADVVFSKEY